MAPYSSTLAWKIPWMEKAGRLQSMGLLRVEHEWAISLSLSCIGEGNGNPLQCSCLENPRDRGVWWAAVSGVAQSWTWLKRLSISISIVGLHCSVSFRYTAKWLSYTYICIYFFQILFPCWLLHTIVEFPVWYSRTLLFIHSECNSLYLPTPNSQSIPLSLHNCEENGQSPSTHN